LKTINIILPVYREEEVLPRFHQALVSVLDRLAQYRFEVTYVLDRSPDNSLLVLQKLAQDHPNITVLHLSRRFGHQMSLVAGIDNSTADAVIMMDCDLQHPPGIIPELLRKFEEGYDIVQTIREYGTRIGLFKKLTSRTFYRLQNALSPVEIQEGAADFRLVSAKVARLFRESVREQNQFLRGLFQWVGFRTATVTFVSPPREAGQTKYHLLRLLTFSVVGITSFSKLPLRLASILGFIISACSLLYGLWSIALYFRVRHLPPGYTSLIVMALFMGGLQLLVLGILGEYIGGIFDEVKRRPLYIIDEVIRGGKES
jgi:glycosyltransferase involved in cell wall biosynthesis